MQENGAFARLTQFQWL